MTEVLNAADWIKFHKAQFKVVGIEFDRPVMVERIKDGHSFSRGSTIAYRGEDGIIQITTIWAFISDNINVLTTYQGVMVEINNIESALERDADKPNSFLHSWTD